MKRRATLCGALVVALLFVGGVAQAGDYGQFTEVEGVATVLKANGQTIQAMLGGQVRQGDVIRTAKSGKATVLFQNGSVLRIGPSSKLTVEQLVHDRDKGFAKSAYELASGSMMSIVGSIFGEDESEFRVNTPTAVAGVRGTVNVIKVGVNPKTGLLSTFAAGIDGVTTVRGKKDKGGGGCVIAPGKYGIVDDQSGLCEFGGDLPDGDLRALLDSFEIGDRSLNQRARGLRGSSGGSGSMGGSKWYPAPDFFKGTSSGGGGDGGSDPEDLFQTRDNPTDVLPQEPPLASEKTEIIITVTVP